MAITESPSIRGSKPSSSILNNETFRSIVFQFVTVVCIFGLGWFFVTNTIENMSQRGMSAGFGFLDSSAGFGISFTLIPYTESDSYFRVFQVGIANTLLVAVISIFGATVIGLIVGLMRMSKNWLVRTIARWYIEILRNTPLLLQIIAWYFGVFNLLPRPRDSLDWGGLFFLNNRGFYMPGPIPGDGFTVTLIALVIAIAAAVGLRYWARKRQEATGKYFPAVSVGLAVIVALPLAIFLLSGAPLAWDVPVLQGFNYRGGVSVPPALCALVLALAIYTSCFIAEIVRSGRAIGQPRADGSRARTRREALMDHASDHSSAGAAGDHSAADQPVSERHQEFLAGHRHRLPRSRECVDEHFSEPVRAGDPDRRHDHGLLLPREPVRVADHERL